MNKISIIIPTSTGHHTEVSTGQLVAAYEGCKETLIRLGSLAECVKLIRVRFEKIGNTETLGPSFEVIFANPLGTECSHSTDYRFMGERGTKTYGSPTPLTRGHSR